MVLAAIYPVLLWFLVFRYRRTWPGLLLVILGTALVWYTADLIAWLGRNDHNGGFAIFAGLIRGEMFFVGLVSIWLWSMRRKPTYPHCPYCRYDLRGHTVTPETVCPECGQRLTPIKYSRPKKPVQNPDHQHQGGQDPDQEGPQPTQLGR